MYHQEKHQEDKCASQEDHFTRPTQATNSQKWLTAFYSHLSLPDSSHKRIKTVNNTHPTEERYWKIQIHVHCNRGIAD